MEISQDTRGEERGDSVEGGGSREGKLLCTILSHSLPFLSVYVISV